MAKQILTDINMKQNELQNVVIQNLATAPANPKAGQEYFNTTDHKKYIYDGSAWVDETNQGKVYTYQNGVEELTGDDAGKVQVKIASGDNAGNVTLSANSNGLKAVAPTASTSTAGLIEIATDTEVTTGTSETLAVNPKQLATKVTANNAITGATKCKITYDNKGLVTAGADLTASDIPNLTLAKITDVTATASEVNVLDGITASTEELNILDGVTADASEINVLDGITASTAELNIMDGVTVTASDINSVTSKIDLTDLSVATGSTNYLGYDNTTGQFSAKVDTTVTASSTNLVTSGAVDTAINNAIVGGVIYKGTWSATGQTDYSSIALPVKKGYLYYVSEGSDVTIGGITWNAGDFLLVNENVASGGTLTNVSKIDNTEATDIVRLNATQTLTNKTIDADDNTILDLTTSNLKSGTVATSISAESSAVDTKLASEKAVATAIKDFITASSTNTLTNKTIDADDNTISDLTTTNFKSGVIVASSTGIADVSSASDSKVPTEKAVASALAGQKISEQNPALTPTSGVCTWEIINSLGTDEVTVVVREVSTGEEVVTGVIVTASKVTITMNSSTAIAKDTYKAIIRE